MKILLAEDEIQLSNVFKAAMVHQGYHVDQAYNGLEALELAEKNAYDIMVFDIMMPLKTGLEALRELRSKGDMTYAILLTAMGEIDDRIAGLDSGADDYLTKPISLKELLARLRSMERRFEINLVEQTFQVGQVHLDLEEQELVAGNSIRLANKEAKLMAYLMKNVGKKLATQEIFQHVWGKDTSDGTDEGYVWIYVSYLRQKLKAIKANLEIIGEENGHFELIESGG